MYLKYTQAEAIRTNVDKEDVDKIYIPTKSNNYDDERAMQNIGRQGKTNIINESGLYALIIRSNKPQAKAFRKWVTSEVLIVMKRVLT